MSREIHAVYRPPNHEGPSGAVPQPAQQHRDEQVQVRPPAPAAVSAERDIQVVPQPLREGDVPTPPELCHVAREVGLRKVDPEMDPEEAANVLWEMEALLCCGPAGGAGYRGHITPSALTYSALLERDRIKTTVEFIQA